MSLTMLSFRIPFAILSLVVVACHPDRTERSSARAPDPVTQSPALSGPACRKNSECGPDHSCVVGSGGSMRGTPQEPHAPPHECDTDAQCPQFRTCRHETCGPTQCKSDDDCNGGYCVDEQCGARIGRCRSMRETQVP